MKRSEINQIMRDAVVFIGKHGFKMPPFATWTIEDWKNKGHEYDEIRDSMLGWDITDFGDTDFYRVGLLMFTIRNGNLNIPEMKTYSEKILVVRENQITPFHFHWSKMEDIINRGGGILCLQLYNSMSDGNFDGTDVKISKDGRNYCATAGVIVELLPGESISIPTGLYHKFWGKNGNGDVLIGEVSRVNDDNLDNRFHDKVGRFPKIEEDEESLYYLFSEYPDSY